MTQLCVESLYQQLQEELVGFVNQRLRDFQAAEDLVQDAFFELSLVVDDIRQPRSWLYRRLTHDVIDHKRRQQRRHYTGADEVLDYRQSAFEEAEAREEGERMQRAIARLGRQERYAIRGVFFDHRTYADVANALAVPCNTVSSLIHRAKIKMRSEVA